MKTLFLLVTLVLAVTASDVRAQPIYPEKPVRVVSPFPPGGVADTVARVLAQKMTESFGRPAVVENRAGAGGTIGTDFVAKSPADGYTLLVGNVSTLAVAPGVYTKLPYNPAQDFSPITLVGRSPMVFAVHPSVPAKTPKELIALARAHPGKMTFGSSGAGSITHFAGELLNAAGKVNITHVPYKGAAPAMTDLLGGRVQFMLINIAVSMPHLKSGKVSSLGIASAARSPVLPNLPTFAEAGYKDFESNAWFALVAPAGTPRAIVDKIGTDTATVLALPEIKDQRLAEQGLEPYPLTPEQLAAQVRLESDKFSRLIKQAGVTVD
jgi:tripartite-type tricarboxylate transporter receptor subunit TctC